MNALLHYLSIRKTRQLATLSSTPLGNAALTGIQQKLQLAGDELHRMEDEGGPPLNDAQNLEVARYLRANVRLKKIMHAHPPIIPFPFFRKKPPMPQHSLGKSLLYTAVIIAVSIVGYNVLFAPDRRSGAQKISDAVDALPDGIDKASRQLESRTPADKLQDAAQDATNDLKKSTNQQ